jgi:hypothetical protein
MIASVAPFGAAASNRSARRLSRLITIAESPGGGTASSTRRATARRRRAYCRASLAAPPATMAAFDESCRRR